MELNLVMIMSISIFLASIITSIMVINDPSLSEYNLDSNQKIEVDCLEDIDCETGEVCNFDDGLISIGKCEIYCENDVNCLQG